MKKAYVDFIRYSLGVESNIPASIGEITLSRWMIGVATSPLMMMCSSG